MKKTLIVWGGRHDHQPELCAPIVRDTLQAHEFEAPVETQTAAFADSALVKFSLIVPIFAMDKIEKEECACLTRVLRSGVGQAGFHGEMSRTSALRGARHTSRFARPELAWLSATRGARGILSWA